MPDRRLMNVVDLLNFDKPRTPLQWLIFTAAIGITLSSPVGTRAFLRELNKHIFQEGGNKKDYEPAKLSQALYELKKRKIIKTKRAGGKTLIELTEKGKRRKLYYDLGRLKIPEQKSWDGKWRILMFDIPESKKTAREALRSKLKRLNFIQFQKSIWVYPYPCENEIDFVAEYFLIAKYLTLITVKMEDDKPLRSRFKI